jgi:hypothetical protein
MVTVVSQDTNSIADPTQFGIQMRLLAIIPMPLNEKSAVIT